MVCQRSGGSQRLMHCSVALHPLPRRRGRRPLPYGRLPWGPGSVGNPGLDFLVLQHPIIVRIGSVKILGDALEEFIHGELPVFIAIGSCEPLRIGSRDALVLFEGQEPILVAIDKEKRVPHALKELDTTDLAIPVLVRRLHDLFPREWLLTLRAYDRRAEPDHHHEQYCKSAHARLSLVMRPWTCRTGHAAQFTILQLPSGSRQAVP